MVKGWSKMSWEEGSKGDRDWLLLPALNQLKSHFSLSLSLFSISAPHPLRRIILPFHLLFHACSLSFPILINAKLLFTSNHDEESSREWSEEDGMGGHGRMRKMMRRGPRGSGWMDGNDDGKMVFEGISVWKLNLRSWRWSLTRLFFSAQFTDYSNRLFGLFIYLSIERLHSTPHIPDEST